MRKINIPCDNCKKKFVVKKPKKKIHSDGVEGKLTIFYITCTHCKKKFVSFVENEKIRKMIKQNKILHNRLKTITDNDMYEKVEEEFQKAVKRIDTVRKDLIFRFAKYV